MNTVGKFRITDIFTNKDRKRVIVGDLLEGTITVDNFISFMTEMGEMTSRILDIEKGKTISGIPFTGLLTEPNDQFELPELKLLRNTESNIIGVELPS